MHAVLDILFSIPAFVVLACVASLAFEWKGDRRNMVEGTMESIDNRTIEMDNCDVVRLDGVEVQENGIIRDARGWIIGRADTEWMRYQWRMIVSGVCPCCGREVDGDAR